MRLTPSGGGKVRRLLPHRTRRMVGPFIYADVIGPETLVHGSGINVDAHPHIGLSTVTYLFDGRTERSHPDDLTATRNMHGLQTWVALRNRLITTDPGRDHTRP